MKKTTTKRATTQPCKTQRLQPATADGASSGHFGRWFAKAKETASGGLVLFQIENLYYAAFDQDAEVIADALGIVAFPRYTGGPKQVLIDAGSIGRVLAYVRSRGNEDVWLLEPGAIRPRPIDAIGEATLRVRDAVRVLMAAR